MKSYTKGRNLAGTETKNSSAANLTYLDQKANDNYRAISALKAWSWLEGLRYLTTVAATQFLNLPNDVLRVRGISVQVGSVLYTPKLSPSKEHWDQLNISPFSSDIPEWYFLYAGQVGLWPKPSAGGNTINIDSKLRVIDLQFADYSTGTIASVANAGTAVVGASTVWQTQMAGQWISITDANTSNTGDGFWYQIATVNSATSITLTTPYQGLSVSAGSSAYTIGQMPLLPESFHYLPWQYATAMYWAKEADGKGRAKTFADAYTGGLRDLIATHSSPTESYVLDDGNDSEIINPNLVVNL